MQVLGSMAATAALLLFQLVFSSVRRRSRNSFLHGALWLSHTLLPPLTTYAIGLMQSSPANSPPVYPVWALSLFLIAGGANAATAHDLADNFQWMRWLFVYLQSYFVFAFLCRILLSSTSTSVAVPFAILATTVASSHALGLRASSAAGDPAPSKVVADHMKGHAAASSSSQDGCRVARGGRSSPSRASYTCELPEDDVITIDMVWDLCDREENATFFVSHGVSVSRIKGACLSYSLSHLLKRRFFGLDCAEARRSETRRFVVDGLLSEDNSDEHTEAFKVIEVELGFLYDFFYTKYACVFDVETTFFFTAVLKIILSFVLGVVVILKSHFVLKNVPVTGPETKAVDLVVTVLVLVVFVAVESYHTLMYLGSDWAMVSLACSRLTTGKSTNRFLPFSLRKPFGFICSRLPLFGYWHNSIGQYSVIESSRFLRRSKAFSFESESELMSMFSVTGEYLRQAWGNLATSQGLHFVELPHLLKPHIISFLKSNNSGHPLSNGKASLQRNVVSRQLSWTLQNETQAETMIIWHIATEYLMISLPDEAKGNKQSLIYRDRELATKLSRYCAYLMSEAPELLPGNSVDTKFIFDHAMYEARETLGSKLRKIDRLRKVLTTSYGDEGTIFTRGLKLGAKLETIQEGSLRWKLMAEFWTETILYVAPSDNARAHMERLARGGEFLTHIWALLTHAGILTRNPIPD
nr:unnamed protein product [Digitaria exilis]